MREVFSYDFCVLEPALFERLFRREKLSRKAPESVIQVGVALVMKVFLVVYIYISINEMRATTKSYLFATDLVNKCSGTLTI
jgi:hypothetical protein